MIGRRTTLALICLLPFTAAAAADEFENGLRAFLGLPHSAEVLWPPRAHVTAGARVDADGQTPDFFSADIRIVGQRPGKFEIDLPADRLDPTDAFWEWRTVLREKGNLSFRFILMDADEINPIDQPDVGAPATQRRVATAWRGKIGLEVWPKPDMPPATWTALRVAATRSKSGLHGGGGQHYSPPGATTADPCHRYRTAANSGPARSGQTAKVVGPGDDRVGILPQPADHEPGVEQAERGRRARRPEGLVAFDLKHSRTPGQLGHHPRSGPLLP